MKHFCHVFFFLLVHYGVWSQCGISSEIAIPTIGTRYANLRIENAVNDDLSSPGQGICGIRARFTHRLIGDVRLILSAPNGRQYVLMEDGGSRSTNGTSWDIRFVPCATPATPDQGNLIKPVWDSDQDWGENNTYVGSYHAETCLEDINSGTVNGIWSLTVSDLRGDNDGFLTSFDLEFCDPTGISCSECVRLGGRINVDTTFVCGGDPSLSTIRIFPTYNGPEPDPALYSYRFVVASGGVILNITSRPDLSAQAAGDYLIYGLSIANRDLALLDGFVGGPLGSLSNALNPGRLRLCGAYASGFKVYRIFSDPSSVNVIERFICPQTSIQFNNQTITTAGIYEATFSSVAGCDSMVRLVVTEFAVSQGIQNPGTISCANKPLVLDWPNQFADQPSYHWSTVDGSILSSTNLSNIKIDLPGQYQLIVAKDGCADTLTTSVVSDGSLPSLEIQDVVMDCGANVGLLRPISNANRFSWTGPKSFTATTQNVDVTEPGSYTVTATGNNCIVRKTIQVSADFDRPQDIQVSGGRIRCAQDTVQISASSSTPNVSYDWIGPNGFSSVTQNPEVTQPGIYTVRISTTSGGCAVQENVEVVNLFKEPSIDINGITLDCRGLSKNIPVTVSDPLATYSWTGPDGFSSTDRSPRVSIPGQYDVVITDAQQCTYQNFSIVTVDTIKPTVTASDIALTCTQSQFTLGANVFSAHDNTIVWVGPNNFRADQINATGTQAGDYTIVVRDVINSCTARTTITVTPDPQQPVLRTENGVINCAQSQDTLVVEGTSNCNGGCTFAWSGPGGFTSNNDSVIVTQGGNYQVVVTSTSGCFSTADFTVPMNTTPIAPNVVVNDIGCTTDGSVVLVNNSLFPSFEWYDTLTQATEGNTRSFTSTTPTVVALHSTDRNGCQDTLLREIGVTDDIPIVQILLDTIDCAKDAVSLGVSIDNYANSQIASYNWTLPDGRQVMDAVPRVDETGTVTLDVVMRNGCPGTTSGEITSDFTPPELEAIGGGFRCSEPGVILDFDTDQTPLLTNWTGPGGFRSNNPHPLASTPGIYRLEILGANGCPVDDSAMVVITDPLPSLTAIGDTITCIDTLANLTFSTNADAGYTFSWIDPGGRISNSTTVQTVLPGPYLVELIDVNGCRVVQEAFAEIDTLTYASRVTSSLINCINTDTKLSLDTNYSFLDYTWRLDSTIVSREAEPMVSTGGLYVLESQNLNGCIRATSHLVQADTMRPIFTLTPDTLDCSDNRISMRPSIIDRTWSYLWSGPNNFSAASSITVMDEPGTYQLRTIAANGCDFSETVSIVADFETPQMEIENTFIPCNGGMAVLSFISHDTLAEVNWFGPNGFYDDMSVSQTDVAGQYFILAKGFNGCEVLDSLMVSAEPLLESPIIDSLHIDCANREGFLAVVNPDTSFTYTWHDEASNTTIDTVVRSLRGQDYLLEARHTSSDCVLSEMLTIRVDTITPSVSIVEMDSIICEHREITLGSEVGRGVHYQWSTSNGNILNQTNQPAIRLNLPGSYQLMVQDTLNQCQNRADVEITERPSNLRGFDLRLTSANCDGQNNGIISVDTIFGGTGPFSFSLGGEFYSSRNSYQFLAPDDYLVVVKDFNGCSADSLITLERDPKFDLDLGEEMLIRLGDTVMLSPEVSLDESQLASISWLQPQDIACSDCLSQLVSPLINTYYTVQVEASNGCVVQDTILIRVGNIGGIYVPNAFTPNGDNINDFVELYAGNNIDKIAAYEIFDRWGNNVFSAFDFRPGAANGRWDGTYRGEKLGPGVYVFRIEAIDIRGDVRLVAGDITLLR